MSLSNRTTRTPNPAQRSLIVSADEEGSLANLVDGILPPEGTVFTDPSWKGIFPADYRKKFRNFRYLTQLEDTKDGAQLIFCRILTDAQRNTPFRTTTRFGNHHWHPILLSLKFIPVEGFPLSTQAAHITHAGNTAGTAYANRYLVRETYIPSVDEGTRFVTEEFISDVPFSIPQYPVPTPTAISYDLINRSGGFPECLHKKIDIGNLIGLLASSATGALTSNVQELEGQIFPATNFTEWAPYYISDTQELTQGCYYRKRVRAFPPPQPDKITRTQ